MSRKHVITKKFIDALAVSSDQTSDVLNVKQTDSGSIHISWTSGSTPNIDIYIQARNGDQDEYRTLSLGTVPNISGASGDHEIIFSEMPFSEMRVFLDRASGSATVSASFIFKSLGA